MALSTADNRHGTLTKTLESIERENKKLLKQEQPEPESGSPATLIGFWDRIPCTVISVEPRRMLVQEDEVRPAGVGFVYLRNPKGVLHGFRRRLNGKKWTYAADWQAGKNSRTLGIVIGERLYERPDIG